MSDGGIEANKQAGSPAELDADVTKSREADLAGALLAYVRDTEAGLDIAAKRLQEDARTLVVGDSGQLVELTQEAAFVAGARTTLDGVAGVIADIVKNKVEDTGKGE